MMRNLVGSLILIFCLSGTVYGQSAREVAQKSFSSVVLLLMEDKNGQVLSQGSGFVVGKGVVATNFHVIEGATSGAAKMVGKKTFFPINGVVGVDKKRDLALLSVSGLDRQPLKFAVEDEANVGDKVYAVGNPLGLEGTFSEGIVSGVRHLKDATILQITAPISPGSSGGPILNAKGNVIGVAVATFKTGQNLNFAIPSFYVRNLLTSKSAPKPLQKVATRRSATSVTTQFGSKSSEGVKITHLSWQRNTSMAFSIRNTLRQPVKSVKLLFIFYDGHGDPVHVSDTFYKYEIPARLAKRSTVYVPRGVRQLATKRGGKYGHDILKTHVEVRVLDFKILN